MTYKAQPPIRENLPPRDNCMACPHPIANHSTVNGELRCDSPSCPCDRMAYILGVKRQ